MSHDDLRDFIRRHKVALAVAALLLLIWQGADNRGDEADMIARDGMDDRAWEERQRSEDGMQRDRVDTIREVERCMGDDGRVYEAPLGTCT